MSNGKGSKPRPLSVSRNTYEHNWDTVFGGESSYQYKCCRRRKPGDLGSPGNGCTGVDVCSTFIDEIEEKRTAREADVNYFGTGPEKEGK